VEIKIDDLVMCSVDKIEGTAVFVKIEGYGPGTIMFSEIAAGRIRNIREYVFPNKKIVCKVLKISPDHIELSLRRVTGKEREEMEEKYQKEKTFQGMLKTVSATPGEIVAKIKEKYDIGEFIENMKENPSSLSEFLKKEDVDKITKILSEKKEKAKEVKKIIKINDDSESGINDIKYTLDVKNVEIHYLGSSQFSVTAKAKDFKSAQNVLDSAIQEIQKRAKERKAVLEVKEK